MKYQSKEIVPAGLIITAQDLAVSVRRVLSSRQKRQVNPWDGMATGHDVLRASCGIHGWPARPFPREPGSASARGNNKAVDWQDHWCGEEGSQPITFTLHLCPFISGGLWLAWEMAFTHEVYPTARTPNARKTELIMMFAFLNSSNECYCFFDCDSEKYNTWCFTRRLNMNYAFFYFCSLIS